MLGLRLVRWRVGSGSERSASRCRRARMPLAAAWRSVDVTAISRTWLREVINRAKALARSACTRPRRARARTRGASRRTCLLHTTLRRRDSRRWVALLPDIRREEITLNVSEQAVQLSERLELLRLLWSPRWLAVTACARALPRASRPIDPTSATWRSRGADASCEARQRASNGKRSRRWTARGSSWVAKPTARLS